MAVETNNLAIGNHNALIGNQILKADARPQFTKCQQGIALLVIDKYILELQLVKRSD